MDRFASLIGLRVVPAEGWSVVSGVEPLSLTRDSGGETLVFEVVPTPQDPASAAFIEGLQAMLSVFAGEGGLGAPDDRHFCERGHPVLRHVAASFRLGRFTRVWFVSYAGGFLRARLTAKTEAQCVTTACNQMIRALVPDTGDPRDDTSLQVAELIERLPGAAAANVKARLVSTAPRRPFHAWRAPEHLQLDLAADHPPAPGADPFTALHAFGNFLTWYLWNEGHLDEVTAKRRLTAWGGAERG